MTSRHADSQPEWVTFPAEPDQVPRTREYVDEVLTHLGVQDPQNRAEISLLACELFTNAVRYTIGEASMRIRRDGNCLRVEVCDSEPQRLPIAITVPNSGRSGRGLLLVEAMSARWGVLIEVGEKIVWFEHSIVDAV